MYPRRRELVLESSTASPHAVILPASRRSVSVATPGTSSARLSPRTIISVPLLPYHARRRSLLHHHSHRRRHPPSQCIDIVIDNSASEPASPVSEIPAAPPSS
jgi:hypothetical protein